MSTQITDTGTKAATGDAIWWKAKAIRGCDYCGSPECTSFEHERWSRDNETTLLRRAVAA